MKLLELEADYWLFIMACLFKHTWRYAYTLQEYFKTWCLIKHREVLPLPYFTLSKSSTSLYGFLYFVLHLFLSLLSPRIYYLCKIIQHLTTIHLWSLCKFYNWGWNLTLFFHISCKPPSMIIQFVLIYYIVSDKLLKISLWHSLVFINCMYAYHH